MSRLSPAQGRAGGVGFEVATAALQGELELDELVEGQALAGRLAPRPPLAGKCSRRRAGARGMGSSGARLGQGSATCCRDVVQGPPDQAAQPALGEPFGEGIDGDDAADVDRAFLTPVHRLGLRVVHRGGLE